MACHRLIFATAILACSSLVFGGSRAIWAQQAPNAPTAEQALGLTPIQPNIEFAKPTPAEVRQCTIRAEKENGSTAWIVRSGQGEILRRFADTNNDNIVDQWCYYLDGLEVYRDIDSDFNGKADQYRWFHTAGTRWGIDRNEDGRIDSWRAISPHEVAEEAVTALRTRDQARFELLLLSSQELSSLGLGRARADSVAATLKAASADFRKLAGEQKVLTSQSRYADFGISRPATIPSGTGGSTKDLLVHDNVSALVLNDGKHEQIFLGTLVSVGNIWKLIDLPSVGPDGPQPAGGFLLASSGGPTGAALPEGAPSEEMQRLMTELERLDRQTDSLAPDKLAASIDQRADVLLKLAEVTPDAELRNQWYRQLADMVSVAVQANQFPQGLDRLDQLQRKLSAGGVDPQVIAHVKFQRLWAEYVSSQQQPEANAATIQEKWLADLQEFIKQHPTSLDSAEALLQLGMNHEYMGKRDEAQKWYRQLVSDFPNAPPAQKGAGAIRRLSSVGRPLQLRGQEMRGGTVDISAYRGKLLLIQYWATWCEPCKQDMIRLKDIYAKNGGRTFEIVGICLDSSPAAARQFLNENRIPWKQLHEPGGLDGRLANELGVMTLPLMLLVDQKGNVLNDGIHAAELDAELARLLK